MEEKSNAAATVYFVYPLLSRSSTDLCGPSVPSASPSHLARRRRPRGAPAWDETYVNMMLFPEK